jgi:hypothetical protein
MRRQIVLGALLIIGLVTATTTFRIAVASDASQNTERSVLGAGKAFRRAVV